MKIKQEDYQKIVCAVFAIISTISINMRNTLYIGNCPENKFGNILSRIYSIFNQYEYTDIIVFVALYVFFLWGIRHFDKISISGIIVSILLSISYILSIFYRNFNSTEFIWCDSFQKFAAFFEFVGIGLILYFLINTLDWYFTNRCWQENHDKSKESFIRKHFFIIAFLFIFICWSFWLFTTYPGTTNPDAIAQLKVFYGDMENTMWQPPFSTLIMGGLFHIGWSLVNANFGFFLYNLFQGIIGALIFAYSLNLFAKRNVPFTVPVVGMLFFGLFPMWGAYIQWFEKDFLYTVSVVLFATLIANILIEKKCTVKMLVAVCFSGIAMTLLRNNGIYVLVPTLIVAAVSLKGLHRKRLGAALIIVFVVYEIIVKAIYPALGIGKTSISETIGCMFQATARYVQEYPEELTKYEKEVLSQNFQDLQNLNNYNPRINDPVKIYYNHSDFDGYLKIWLEMFGKHPVVYLESLLNGAYGYMAPVSVDFGTYVSQGEYDFYVKNLGLSHANNGNLRNMSARILDLTRGFPVLHYLASPGLYTWLSIVAIWLLWKNKKAGMVLLIPNIINILVCVVSPLADAMRYALPTVAVTPLIIGWLYLAFNKN